MSRNALTYAESGHRVECREESSFAASTFDHDANAGATRPDAAFGQLNLTLGRALGIAHLAASLAATLAKLVPCVTAMPSSSSDGMREPSPLAMVPAPYGEPPWTSVLTKSFGSAYCTRGTEGPGA